MLLIYVNDFLIIPPATIHASMTMQGGKINFRLQQNGL